MALPSAELAHRPAPDEAAVLAAASDVVVRQTVRVWVSGHVALEPLELRQVQPFADWTHSSLRYDVGIGDTPPAGYTGVTYDRVRTAYPASPYMDNFGYADL